MRPLKVTFAPRARKDIDDIHAWLCERSRTGAASVISAVRETSLLNGEYPQIGRNSDIEGVKLLPVLKYPYLVYYTIDRDEIVIVHIRHGARTAPKPGEV